MSNPGHYSNSIRVIKMKLGIGTHCGWQKVPLLFGGHWGHFWGQAVNFGVTRGKFWWSLEHNSKNFKAIYLKPGTDGFLGSGKMLLYFWVMGVNIGVTWSILGSLPFPCDNSNSIMAIKLKPGYLRLLSLR